MDTRALAGRLEPQEFQDSLEPLESADSQASLVTQEPSPDSPERQASVDRAASQDIQEPSPDSLELAAILAFQASARNPEFQDSPESVEPAASQGKAERLDSRPLAESAENQERQDSPVIPGKAELAGRQVFLVSLALKG